MDIIDVYGNKNGDLIVKLYDNRTRRNVFLRNRDAELYLQKLSNYKIIDVLEQAVDNKEKATIKYGGFNVEIHDIFNIKNNNKKHLTPLVDSYQKYEEKKAISELRQRSSEKRKVTRENKHSNRKIVFTGISLVAAVAISLSVMATHLKAEEIVDDNSVSLNTPSIEFVQDDFDIETPTPTIVEDFSYVEADIKEFEPEIIRVEYEDLSDTKKANFARENYGAIIENYAHQYGLDANLMLAIATQERGVHSSEKDKGGATGLMQIQNSVWLNEEISAYNFKTGTNDRFVITEDMIKDLDTNIQLGCMIFQNCLKSVNYNIPMAVQTYNYGIGNMRKVIEMYANESNQTKNDIINNPSDLGWMEYRDIIKAGDTNYLNHVFSWIGEEQNIAVMKKDSTIVELSVTNNLEVSKTY